MGRKATKEEFKHWQRHVESFDASGLTRKAYSKKNRIQVYQLDYWRRKISRMDKTQDIPGVQWVPLKISDEPAERDSHIDLWVGSFRIEIKPGFDPKLLAELLRTVGAGC